MKLKKASIFISLVCVANVANAGYSTGLVTELFAHTGDIVIFTAGTHQSPPNDNCQTAGDGWALSLATQTGRAMYALLLSAQAQGKAVSVSGTASCTAWPDRETPYYIRLP